MSYAILGGQDVYAVSESPDVPYLDRVVAIAEEAERSATLIEGFIARCRGGGIMSGASAATAPMPSGHFAQLNRLRDAVSEIDKLARELGTIG
jgi:hypothetical protein